MPVCLSFRVGRIPLAVLLAWSGPAFVRDIIEVSRTDNLGSLHQTV